METNEAKQKAWIARMIYRMTCKTKGCDNQRAGGSSRCKDCTKKHREAVGLDGDFSIMYPKGMPND